MAKPRKSKKGPPKNLPSMKRGGARRKNASSGKGGPNVAGGDRYWGESRSPDARKSSSRHRGDGGGEGGSDTKAPPKRAYDPSRPHRSRGAETAHVGAAYGLGAASGQPDDAESEARELHESEMLVTRLMEALAEPHTADQLAERVGVLPVALQRPLRDLAERGLIVASDNGPDTIYRRAKGATAAGYITKQRAGLGFIPDDRTVPIMAIERGHTRDAVPGDRVLVTWRAAESFGRGGRRGSGYMAKVASIITERPTEVTGIVDVNSAGEWVLRLWGQNKPREVQLDILSDEVVKPGELVKAHLPRAEGHTGAVAEFRGVVASMDVPSQDSQSIAAIYDLRTEFPEDALRDVDGLGDDPSDADMQGRLDLRDQLIITIDPKDARDHDDAISVEHMPDGLTRLGVHIADVSHYVVPGTALYEEAWARATSTYLPGLTIPMLPLKLSAGLCSLKEGRDRLAMTCFMVFDAKGRLVRREIYPSVIRVKRFLNYEQALGILEDRYSDSPEVDGLVRDARALADKLNRLRLDEGSVVLTIDRPHLVLGEKGELVEIQVERSDASHNLIEECMLAANRAVAAFLIERNCPYIGRIHPEPDGEAEAEFAEFCEKLGVAAPNFEEPRRVQMFLDGLKGNEGAPAINLAVLKSMKRAIYSAQPGLHYALGFYEYTHFTSPIRRLCDMSVHQVLKQYIEAGGDLKWQERPLPFVWCDGAPGDKKIRKLNGAEADASGAMRLAMPSIARQASDREQVSQKAEMETVQLKLLRLMQGRVGEQFEGTVQHISVQGVAVQLDEVWCEGTMFYTDLTNDWVTPRKFWVELDTKWGPMSFKVGDRVTVVVDEVIVPNRAMRLKLPVAALAKREGKGFTFTDMRKGGGGSGRDSGGGSGSGSLRSGSGGARSGGDRSSGGHRSSGTSKGPADGRKPRVLFDGSRRSGKGGKRKGRR